MTHSGTHRADMSSPSKPILTFPSLLSNVSKQALADRIPAEFFDSFLCTAKIGTIFSEFVSSGWFDLALTAIYRSFLEHPDQVDALLGADSGIICSWGARSISFQYYKTTPKMIYSSPLQGWMGLVSSGEIEVQTHECIDNFKKLATPLSKHVLAKNDTLLIDSERYVYGYNIIRPAIGLRLFEHIDRPTSMYDRESLIRLAHVSDSGLHSEIVMAYHLLAETGAVHCVDAIAMGLRHEAHFVRWEAAKAIAMIAPERVPEMLRALADDPHPEIRAAVARSMQKLQTGPP